MDFLYLLAEGAKLTTPQALDEDFVKWLAGFLVAGYLPLLIFLKQLLEQRKSLLEGQVVDANTRAGMTETIRKELEEEIRKRYQKVIKDKDADYDKIEIEVKLMRVEKLHMLTKQIEDGHLQEKSLNQLSEDYNEALSELKPILSENVEVLQYYRTKRERGRS
jgi:hypothetical protein